MKLCTFDAGSGAEVGLYSHSALIPLTRIVPRAAPDMMTLIANWHSAQAEVCEVQRNARTFVKFDQACLLPPIARPGKILAIGLNYSDHIKESGLDTPKHQVWFCKQTTAVNAPFHPIEVPKVSKRLDYEAELVAVIGTRGRHIAITDAANFVFGYCCGNDVSVRDWQVSTPQWMLGKSFDTHAPYGPWIVTADEVNDPHSLGIRCFVNGQKRQESNTRHLIFNVWDQIAHLSQAMTLEPGDLLFTGTPGGVGALMKPPQFLKAGDCVRVEIDRLDAIEATLIDES
jgi:ureidoglycolate lyase